MLQRGRCPSHFCPNATIARTVERGSERRGSRNNSTALSGPGLLVAQIQPESISFQRLEPLPQLSKHRRRKRLSLVHASSYVQAMFGLVNDHIVCDAL
jgi:hypothetical protein